MSWIVVEVTLAVLMTAVLFPFAMFALAKYDLFFTKCESGDIKFIMYGKSLHRIIHNVQGMCLIPDKGSRGGKVFAKGEERKTFFNKRFGLWWVGIPPFASVHGFKITKERENPSGKKPEDWIDRDPNEVTVYSLRYTFPRPYVLMDVELGDRVTMNTLVITKLEVVDPYTAVFLFKGKFFENAGGIIRSGVIDVFKSHSLDGNTEVVDEDGTMKKLPSFVTASKDEVDGILKGMKIPETEGNGSFNRELIKQVGLRLVGISIAQYDPGDEDLRKAMEAKTIAFERGEAIKITADAEASATERKARAKEATFKAAVSGLNGDAKAAAEVLAAEAQPLLTTKVTGGSVVLPVGGEK